MAQILTSLQKMWPQNDQTALRTYNIDITFLNIVYIHASNHKQVKTRRSKERYILKEGERYILKEGERGMLPAIPAGAPPPPMRGGTVAVG